MKKQPESEQPVAPLAEPGTKADTVATTRMLKELRAQYPQRRAYVAILSRTLELGRDDAQQAVRLGVDRGWLIPDGDPAVTVAITESGSSIAARDKA